MIQTVGGGKLIGIAREPSTEGEVEEEVWVGGCAGCWVQTVGSYCFSLLIDGNYWEVCVSLCAPPAASDRSGPVIDGFD